MIFNNVSDTLCSTNFFITEAGLNGKGKQKNQYPTHFNKTTREETLDELDLI